MKKLAAMAVFFLLVLFSHSAHAELFAGGYLGVNAPEESTSKDSSGLGLPPAKARFDTGANLGVRGGYWLDKQNIPYLGFFLDSNADAAQMESFDYPGLPVPVEADFATFSLSLNAALRYPSKTLRPYAGIGIGLITGAIDDGVAMPLGVPVYVEGDEDSSIVKQWFLGTELSINKRISAFIEYRHALAEFDFKGGWLIKMDYETNQFFGGVIVRF